MPLAGSGRPKSRPCRPYLRTARPRRGRRRVGRHPNVSAALRDRKKIRILAIGATSIARRDSAPGGYHAIIEQFLERTFKGIDVEIFNRGVSGELARDAAERIKTEVALTEADLVLWQVGTAGDPRPRRACRWTNSRPACATPWSG